MQLADKTIAVLGTAADPCEALIQGRLAREGARVIRVGTAGMPVAEAQEVWFDALLIPDGPDALRMAADEAVLEWVTQFEINAKPIAAVGRGLLVLAAAELVAGRRVAAGPMVRTAVEEQGGRVSDDPLVEDEMWLTARGDEGLADLLDRLVASVRRIHLAARAYDSPLDD